ncbi:S24 family peptidase [Chitinimonas sp. PSY-7]|uniref:S24 family peptidase n=1 Tax=Chitinimonas sp. PSY-7 TaxID=3459088 RepID=UPI00404005E6
MLVTNDIATEPRPIKTYDDNDPLDKDEVAVKRLSLKVSAGTGRLQWEIDEGTSDRYRLDWIKRFGFDPKKLTTLRVDGDSMMPRLVDGGSVVIDTSDIRPRTGKIYAVDYQGEFFIKRLFLEPDGSIRLSSDNPDKTSYPDWIVKPEHGDVLRIMGRAVQTQFYL